MYSIVPFSTTKLLKMVFQNGTYTVKIMETASFRTLSPNTMAYKSWSAFIALNNARVDTGSVADINEPNAKLKIMQIIIRYGKISHMTGCY